MKYLFSPRKRFSTWRQLWTWLAEAQKGTGEYRVMADIGCVEESIQID
jgi:adenylosuccinate lyase